MLNFGPVYIFFKSEFLRNEHVDPPFSSFQSTGDMISFVCAKFKKKSVHWKNLSYTSLSVYTPGNNLDLANYESRD